MSESLGKRYNPEGTVKEYLKNSVRKFNQVKIIIEEKLKNGADVICLQEVDTTADGYSFFLEFLEELKKYHYGYSSNISDRNKESVLMIIYRENDKSQKNVTIFGEFSNRVHAIILRNLLILNVHLPGKLNEKDTSVFINGFARLDSGSLGMPEESKKQIKSVFMVGDFNKTPEELLRYVNFYPYSPLNLWFNHSTAPTSYHKYYLETYNTNLMSEREAEEKASELGYVEGIHGEKSPKEYLIKKAGEKEWKEKEITLSHVDNAVFFNIFPIGCIFLPARGLEDTEYPNEYLPPDHAQVEYPNEYLPPDHAQVEYPNEYLPPDHAQVEYPNEYFPSYNTPMEYPNEYVHSDHASIEYPNEDFPSDHALIEYYFNIY